MSRGEARFLHLATALIGGTGLVYAWMRYLAETDDPFALVNHPWQPTVQHLHVLVAPLLVFGLGLVWRNHVWKRLRGRDPERRRTGIALLSLVLPMVASGYALQVADSEIWRRSWIVVHVASSCAFLVVYGVHLLSPKPAESASAAERQTEARTTSPELEATTPTEGAEPSRARRPRRTHRQPVGAGR